MIATFIHRGDAIEHVPAADLPAGSVVVLGALVGVAVQTIPTGHLGALQLTGVFELPRLVGGVIAVGTRLFWDAANQRATTDEAAGANAYLGKAVAESGDTAPTIRVRLEQ